MVVCISATAVFLAALGLVNSLPAVRRPWLHTSNGESIPVMLAAEVVDHNSAGKQAKV